MTRSTAPSTTFSTRTVERFSPIWWWRSASASGSASTGSTKTRPRCASVVSTGWHGADGFGDGGLPTSPTATPKDHRPDLKQLLFTLTTSGDGAIPVQSRCADGNTNDSTTHIETWEALRLVADRADFLYVADSKLCTRENMDHIDRRGRRFVTVMPRSRLEDAEFRKWIQTHPPEWEKVWDRPNPR
jgi:hypothetical protein